MRSALSPALCWDQVHPALWLQVMPFARPNLVELSHSGYVVQRLNTGILEWDPKACAAGRFAI